MARLVDDDRDVLDRRARIEAPVQPERYTALRRLVTRSDHRFVLALGGGSAPAIAGNIALLSLLEELDLRSHVQQVWGTSAGAIVGGPWATGTPAGQLMHYALQGRSEWDLRWLPLGVAFLLRPFGWPLPPGLVKGRRFARIIEKGLRVQRFDDCEIPFRCLAATTVGQPRAVVLSEGALLPAILTSMCLPGVFEPQCDQLAGETANSDLNRVPSQVHENAESNARSDNNPGEWLSNGGATRASPTRENGSSAIGAHRNGTPPLSACCDGGLVEKTPLRSPIGEHLRSGDPRSLLLLATHFGVHGRRAAATDFIHRFLYGVDVMEELAWPGQLQEARQYPRVQPLVLDPRIVEPHSLDLTRLPLHYLRAREYFADRLQNARLALALGVE